MIDYRDVGLKAYGSKCEWAGCGWSSAPCDVHHTNYQEHQAQENELRKVKGDHYQLPKSVLSKDLSVLCPNHHRYTHDKDLGLGVLKYLPERR